MTLRAQAIVLVIGATYSVKHTSGVIRAKFLGEVERGWKRASTHYRFENLNTGREIEIKSRGKIRACPDSEQNLKTAGA